MYICKLYHAKNAGILPKFGCFAKKNERSTSVGKGMKDQTVFFFMCGGSGWDGWNYEARKGILIHTCCSNKRRIYSDKWRKDFRKFRHWPCLSAKMCFAWCICDFPSKVPTKTGNIEDKDGWDFLLRANFRRIHCDVFFSMDFFWLEKYRTLKYSQPSPKYTAVKIDPIQHPPKLSKIREKGPCFSRRFHCPTISFPGMWCVSF